MSLPLITKGGRKLVTMQITVSVPGDMTPGQARREARELINSGTGFEYYAGEALKVRKIGAAPANKYDRP